MSGLSPNTFSLIPLVKTIPFFKDNIIVRYGVPGDGTCFYYSLCAVLNIERFLEKPVELQVQIGRQFRCSLTHNLTWDEWKEFLAVKHLRARKIKSLEQLKQKMCSYRVWADEPVIRFIMYKLKLNLIFLDQKLNKLYCGVDEPEAELTAVIYWVNKSHFEPLGRLNALDVDNDRVAVQFQFYKDTDSEFIDSLMQKYGQQCSL